MATKKITKRERIEAMLEKYDFSPDEVAFFKHELELLAKKNSKTGEKKPTPTRVMNEGLKTDILDFMEVGKKYTVTDFMKSVPALEGMSNQKVNALVRQLKDSKAVVRTEEKGKAYFALA